MAAKTRGDLAERLRVMDNMLMVALLLDRLRCLYHCHVTKISGNTNGTRAHLPD